VGLGGGDRLFADPLPVRPADDAQRHDEADEEEQQDEEGALQGDPAKRRAL
jgi:hypothetical protein